MHSAKTHDHSTCGIGAEHEHERDARDAAVEAEYKHQHAHSNRQARTHGDDEDAAVPKSQDFRFKHTCEMSLVADKHFLFDNGNSEIAATEKMVGYIADANQLYSRTSFDIDNAYADRHLEGIQLAVAKVTIFATAVGDAGK